MARIFILLLCVLIAGCANQPVYSEHCQIQLTQYQLSRQLQSDGVQVIQVGDEITLLLPAHEFFYPDSNNLRNVSPLLNHIVDFLNTYPTVDIQVKGYTVNRGDYVRGLALSRAQAQTVASYLWKNGLNSRLISAQGLGCHNAYNMNHIEIFFRIPPPDNVFH